MLFLIESGRICWWNADSPSSSGEGSRTDTIFEQPRHATLRARARHLLAAEGSERSHLKGGTGDDAGRRGQIGRAGEFLVVVAIFGPFSRVGCI